MRWQVNADGEVAALGAGRRAALRFDTLLRSHTAKWVTPRRVEALKQALQKQLPGACLLVFMLLPRNQL